jgi:ribose transport system ATP-binding protein
MSSTVTTPPAERAALRVLGVSKSFPGTQALKNVWLQVGRGELHALLGGNGSGKSTLIKILAGLHAAEPGGSVVVHGHELDAQHITPPLARRVGLRFVHQQPAIFGDLTVAENLFLDEDLPTRFVQVDWRRLRREARALIERFHIDAEPGSRLGSLRPATQTMVAIARALKDADSDAATILVLDEPTAALPDAEVQVLLGALRRYASAGHSILYVTHRLGEVVAAADGATVLRDGTVAARLGKNELTEAALVAHITGGRGSVIERRPATGRGRIVLDARGVAGGPIHGVDLRVHAGEVLGVAGLLGSGRTTLLEMIFGARPLEGGTLELGGSRYRPADPADAIARGVVYVPEDRLRRALFPDLSVAQNLSAPALRSYRRFGRLRRRREAEDARRTIARYAIKARSERDPIALLSGGNQQKAVLGRWLARSPRLVLLDEPTQGVDVGARVELHRAVRAAADDGAGVLFVSSDLVELAEYSDRVLVLRSGEFVGELSGERLHEHDITAALHVAGGEAS